MDPLQFGVYQRLCGTYWTRGEALIDDDYEMANIARCSKKQWLSVRPAMARMFVIEGGRWTHPKTEIALSSSRRAYDNAINRARKGAEKRWSNEGNQQVSDASSNAQAMPKHALSNANKNHNQNKKEKKDISSPSAAALEGFEDFWSAYSRHDSRRAAEKAFPRALKKVGGDLSIIVRAAKSYSRQFVTGAKDKQYQAMAASWLNGERWTDSSLRQIETQEHSEPTQAEVFAAAAAQIGDNPVSLIPSWFKGD
jgi:uncharacterized protein YdaU (DUF1376 family)